MKSVEVKTWNIFHVEINEKIWSIVEDRTWKMYYCPDLGISNENCGGQNLEYFQCQHPWKKYNYHGGLNIENLPRVEDKTRNIFNVQIHEKSISIVEDRT